MNIEAMQQLVRVLKAVPPEHFDMQEVVRLGTPFTGVATPQVLHTCGSAACAIGYAAADPWFQERGLSMDFYGSRFSGADETRAAEILGISEIELDLIFVADHPLVDHKPLSDIKPQDMVAVVEAMIANHLASRPLDYLGDEE